MKSKLQMMKRADGSSSPRGLWDNLRAKAAENHKNAHPKRADLNGKPGGLNYFKLE